MQYKRIRGEKYIWSVSEPDVSVLEIAARYNLSIPVARAIVHRGYTDSDSINDYLFGMLGRDLPDPRLMKDAVRAVERIRLAIERGEKILISGDYDVDGITAASLMMACLGPLGAQVNFFLPHRVRDGYGLSTHVIERAAHNGYKVVITVDNGITAFEPALRARELGIDLIITDHHRVQGAVPEAYAVVNPNQSDCTYPYKLFAGVGVIFKVLTILYQQLGRPMPAKAYELLLLGTVADVVPLTGENRFWVRQGLQKVNSEHSLSLAALKMNARVQKPKLSSTDVGFSIAPQINALGRLDDARQGVAFLLGSDSVAVEEIGRTLWRLNQTRKEVEKSVLNDIISQIEVGSISKEDRMLLATGKNWPPGVIGLVASRLVGLYGRPALIFHETTNGVLKGSCRSIAACNIFDALSWCKDLLITFGGHSQAAGLSLKKENFGELKKRLYAYASKHLKPEDFEQRLMIDSPALLSDFTKKFVDDLEYLEPFGHQNPEPLFLVHNVTLTQPPQLLKELHAKAYLFSNGVVKPVIFFNRPDIFERLCVATGPFHVAVQVKENYWNDSVSVELTGMDISFEGVAS